jgi:rhodanese-related sulfurtransferase
LKLCYLYSTSFDMAEVVDRRDSMKLISRDELRAKLDRGEEVKLVMALGPWAFRAKHIPGSIHFDSPEDAFEALSRDDEIVVYCSNPNCVASIAAYHQLKNRGYQNVRRYAGGLEDWEAAGFPLEGEMVERPT